jgi:hypothetical protein
MLACIRCSCEPYSARADCICVTDKKCVQIVHAIFADVSKQKMESVFTTSGLEKAPGKDASITGSLKLAMKARQGTDYGLSDSEMETVQTYINGGTYIVCHWFIRMDGFPYRHTPCLPLVPAVLIFVSSYVYLAHPQLFPSIPLYILHIYTHNSSRDNHHQARVADAIIPRLRPPKRRPHYR